MSPSKREPEKIISQPDACFSQPTTVGSIRRTISATPSSFGWMPSGCISPVWRHDTVEEERVERDVIGLRQVRIGSAEGLEIVLAQIGWRQHAGQHHDYASTFRAADDAVQVAAQLLDRKRPQPVIAAELNQEVGGLVGEHPVEASGTAGRRIAGDAGVLHLAGEALASASAPRKPGRERGFHRHAEAGGQRIRRARRYGTVRRPPLCPCRSRAGGKPCGRNCAGPSPTPLRIAMSGPKPADDRAR